MWFAASTFYLYEYFVRVMPSVMEEELQTHFVVGAGVLAGSLGMYYFIYSPMQMIVGAIFDSFGGKRIIVAACVIVALGCFLPSISTQTLALMTAGRFLMGLGSAFGFVGCVYLSTVWFHPKQLALLAGLTTMLGMIGAIIGQAPLSFLVDNIGWQRSWAVAGWLGIACTVMLLLLIPRTPTTEVDRRKAFRGSTPFANICKSLFAVLKNPQTWLIGLVGGCLYLPLTVFADLWGIQYIRHVAGITKQEAASVVAMLYLGWLIGSPFAGWFSDYIGMRAGLMKWGTFLCFLLLSGMLLFNNIPPMALGTLLFLIGLFSSSEILAFIMGLEANPDFARGSAVAVVNMIIMLLGALFQPIVGILLDWQAQDFSEIGLYSASDYRVAMSVLPLMMGFGLVLSFALKDKKVK